MLAAFADAAALLAREDDAGRAADAARYRAIAERAADRLLAVLRTPDGRFLRSWKDGRARHAGTLEDQACMTEGLLALHEATAEERWFAAARVTAEAILAHFAAPDGGFHDTADDAEVLVARPRSLQDNACRPVGRWRRPCCCAWPPSRRRPLRRRGRGRRPSRRRGRGQVPHGLRQWLSAIDWLVGPIDEIAVIGEPGDARTAALLRVVAACRPIPAGVRARSSPSPRTPRPAPSRSSRAGSPSGERRPRSSAGGSPAASR